ncbi:MAG TPA: DUF4832 domain-containing protein, partial [Planctomycetota bacterium]|nr:DUF4832 domain-containing protein [Planctomycetota bacterium]
MFRPHSTLVFLLLLPSLFLSYSAAAKDKEVVETIPAIDDLLPNPFIGFITDVATLYEHPKIPQTVAFCGITWAELEPVRGEYDFERFEKGWAEQLKLGRKIAFRLKTADPWFEKPAIPKWLIDKGVAMRDYDIAGNKGQAPDWNNDQFLDAHDLLLQALGKRYDNDPRIAWVEIGTYGYWGEWQLAHNEALAASEDNKSRIYRAYLKYFPAKRKIVSFFDNNAMRNLTAQNVGLRDNYLGSDEENKTFLDAFARIDPDLADTQYKTSLIGGEFSGGDEGAHATLTDRLDPTLAFIAKTHWSFIGPTGGTALMSDGPILEHAKTLAKKLGYRLRVSSFAHPEQVRIGDTFASHITIQNDGVAPFYDGWRISILMTSAEKEFCHEMKPNDPAWDIRTWLPGERKLDLNVFYTRSEKFQPGLYTVWIAIIDPETGNPGVWLAQSGR